MRILFSVRKPSYVRHYESVLRALDAQGHEVHLAKEGDEKKRWPPAVLALAEACSKLRCTTTPAVAGEPWYELATRLRQARFYLRFLDSIYAGTPALLARSREKAPPLAVRLGESPLGRVAAARRLLIRGIDVLERATGSAAAFHDYLRELRPDVVVLTPLVILKTSQLDLARAAMELGIRNVFAVASWDHLSSKGELTFAPQQVIVWNDVQKREAVELHHLPADRIVTTGSQVFDDWFGRAPSSSREAFCARVGLHAGRPFLLYVCSALFEGSPPEPDFVVRWIRHLRASGHPALRDCGILVRPHFKRGDEWRGVSFEGLENVVCWPAVGAAPVDAGSKTDYFDSLYHATATVGLNTSAMIEAAILGRPVHTVLLPEYYDNQEGTLHFRYLLDPATPLLRAARSLDAHAEHLADTLEGRDLDPQRSERFVRAFVRPGSIDVPATTRFVETIEALGRVAAPEPVAAARWARLLRPVLRPFAAAAAERVRRLSEERRRQKEQLLAAHRQKRSTERALARQAQDAS